MIPNVFIDGSVFETERQLGIWRLFYEVMSRTSGEVDYTLLLACEPKHPVPKGVRIEDAVHRSPLKHRLNVAGRLRRRRSLEVLRKASSSAIWHSTFFTNPVCVEQRNVVTVYDCISQRFSAYDSALANQSRSQSEAVSRANLILAISHSTARDITALYRTLDAKIVVMPLGYEHLVNSNCVLQSNRTGVLFVGNRRSYKNFGKLVEATSSPLWPEGHDLTVVGPELTAEEWRFVEAFGSRRRIKSTGPQSDAELMKSYRSHSCFVYPSLMEGFGIPIVEASYARCVPVVSDIPAFREVAGDSAIYFNPWDPDSIASAVRDGTTEQARTTFEREVDATLNRYSWDSAAQIVLNAYELMSR